MAVGEHRAADRERVHQGGEGQLGGRGRPHGRAEPGLHLAGHGRLGHHEHDGGHESTRAKSRAARTVPRTEPDTFERVPSARGW